MRLPITAVAIVMLGVIVIVAIVGFFWFTGGFKMTEAQAREVFTSNCPTVCKSDPSLLEQNYPRFLDACEVLWGTRLPGYCLSKCGVECVIALGRCDVLCQVYPFYVGTIFQNVIKSHMESLNCVC